MSEVTEQQKTVLELMSEMLKEQEEKSPLTTSAIYAHNNNISNANSLSSSLSSNNEAQYYSESKVFKLYL
jgi:predicted transcriptional regulator